MGILIFLAILCALMLVVVFQGAESKTKASVVTAVTMLSILGFILFLETNVYLVVQALDAMFNFFAMVFVTVMEFIVTSLQFAIIAFFEGVVWLFVVVAKSVGWVFVNSIWLFGQAPITITMAFCMLCVWGASGE